MKIFQSYMLVLVLLASFISSASAQSVSGQVSGAVTDSAGGVVQGATVELTSDLTKQVRQYTTDSSGIFLFPNLVPGSYSLHVEQAGFKAYNQTGITVAGQEKVALSAIKLEIGSVSTSVDVTAEAAHVATDSSDRTIVVNTTQIQNTPLSGRNFLGVMRTLPGVAVTANVDTRGFGSGFGSGATGGIAVNGGQAGAFLLTLDGISNQDTGTTGSLSGLLSPSVDAIGEVQVMVTNYSAAYGSRSGGQMNATIKSGSAQFHGTAYYYLRHEQFNANEFFNNKTGVQKGKYRYQNPGGTIGGPVVIPGTRFNKDRNKLFFFFSEDDLFNKSTGGVNRFTMPTALERTGDYSQTLTSTGVLIPVKDPTTGNPFPGNKIPTASINPIGAAMMNLFPLPNTQDPTQQRGYNFQTQWTLNNPRRDRIVRVDYGISPKTTAFARLIFDYYGNDGYGSILGANGSAWGQLLTGLDYPARGAVATVIHTFSPNLINESTWGTNLYRFHVNIMDQAQYATNQLPLKDANGKALALPNFFNGNDLSLLPNINFTTQQPQSPGQLVTAPPSYGFPNRFPFVADDTTNDFSDTITWIKGRHAMKFGVLWERARKEVTVYSTYNASGSYWFGSDSANPNDTGYAFSNLLTGAVQAYGQDNKKVTNFSAFDQPEWFVHDTWKATRRVTLDLGIRFQIIQPTYSQGATLSLFSAAAYDPSKAGQLLFPALVNGNRVALNPKTGATYAFPRATAFDPASYPANGNPYSGMKLYDSRFFNTPPVAVSPRLGFAWDVMGNGKTAVRGGFGIFFGRPYGADTIAAVNAGNGPMAAPPAFQSPIFFNTTFGNLLNTQGFVSPQNVNGGSQDLKNQSTYDWHLGVQQDIGKATILDVAYVGNVSHHQFGTAHDFNQVAPYTTWTPAGGPVKAYLDPTSANGGTGALYAANLIRSLSGGYNYGTISTWTQLGESNYNALQAQVNRRFGSRLQFGANYTWSKTIVFNHNQFISDSLTKDVVNTNRPHVFNLNFGYRVPDGSKLVGRNIITRTLLDGWNFNGIGAIFMGTPLTPTCANANTTGLPVGYWYGTPTTTPALRCQMIGNLFLPDGATPTSNGSTADPRLWYPFNAGPAANPQLWNPGATAANTGNNPAFILPSASSFGLGNTPLTMTYGPGFQNWDLSVYKEIPLGHEGRSLTIRAETFNTFNHYNPTNPNMNLNYNFATGAQTNAAFGTITTSAQVPNGAQGNSRRMALSARIRF